MPGYETSEDVRRWFSTAIRRLWPVALGSISLRKSPCIRANCAACASDKGHSSYALSGYRGKRRFSIYVPDELAPTIGEAIGNGRRLQDLIKEAGARYLRAVKQLHLEGKCRLSKECRRCLGDQHRRTGRQGSPRFEWSELS